MKAGKISSRKGTPCMPVPTGTERSSASRRQRQIRSINLSKNLMSRGKPMAAKIDKKELTEPDEMQLFFYRVRMFAKKNRNRIYAGAGFFLLIAVVAGGWYLYRINYET